MSPSDLWDVGKPSFLPHPELGRQRQLAASFPMLGFWLEWKECFLLQPEDLPPEILSLYYVTGPALPNSPPPSTALLKVCY